MGSASPVAHTQKGYLTHHMHIDKGKIVNYQINTPSTLNASPRDPFGNPGPYEQAVIDTPILESVADDQVKGIDVLRSIRKGGVGVDHASDEICGGRQ